MNVFEFLGLSAKHRPQGKVVQLVKNFDEVPDSKVSWPMYGQVKKDGVFGLLVVAPAGVAVFGRTGKRLTNCGYIECMHEDKPFGCYIGEICLPGQSLEVLSGVVNPNRNKPLEPGIAKVWEKGCEMHFHDHLTLLEFEQGKSALGYLDRAARMESLGIRSLQTHLILDELEAEAFAQECISNGEEGAVFKRNLDYVAGHKGFRAMKKVRSISYDLECIGVEEGEGKYTGKVANLIFRWRDGETLKAMLGKGYTHKEAEVMLTGNCLGCGATDPVGKIFRVYGLQDSSKGKIRLPKAGEQRHDKAIPDY